MDDNLKVAQKRNAVQEGMFYFRKDIFKGKEWIVFILNWVCIQTENPDVCLSRPFIQIHFLQGCNPLFDSATTAAQNGVETDGDHEEYTLMSIDTIINGKVQKLQSV